jgi:hypothetical protein
LWLWETEALELDLSFVVCREGTEEEMIEEEEAWAITEVKRRGRYKLDSVADEEEDDDDEEEDEEEDEDDEEEEEVAAVVFKA